MVVFTKIKMLWQKKEENDVGNFLPSYVDYQQNSKPSLTLNLHVFVILITANYK